MPARRALAAAVSALLVLAALAGASLPSPAAAASQQYVHAGLRAYALVGVNVPRGADQLVQYTRPTYASTPTNRWGVEVTVVGGKVTAINDRQANGQLTGTPVPASPGYVLSGHGTARDWLLAWAKIGTAITINTSLTATTWKSGASGDGVPSGAFAIWRGTSVPIAGTWNDNLDSQINQWSLQPGFAFGSWTGDLDVAVGAIYREDGETWAKAAAGAYDGRWTTALTNMKKYWGARTGRLYIRFAHEFNGEWTPWRVSGAEAGNFIAAWKRFRALQKQILPNAQLVFCPNDGTSTSLALDWRKAFPGSAYVDVLSVDTYNQYPFVSTLAGFNAKMNATGPYGEPAGAEKFRQYAAAVSLPFAVSEWGSNADMGDAPVYMSAFYSWFAANAGTGPGRVLYDVYFNVGDYASGRFAIYPTSHQPNAAAQYRSSF